MAKDDGADSSEKSKNTAMIAAGVIGVLLVLGYTGYYIYSNFIAEPERRTPEQIAQERRMREDAAGIRNRHNLDDTGAAQQPGGESGGFDDLSASLTTELPPPAPTTQLPSVPPSGTGRPSARDSGLNTKLDALAEQLTELNTSVSSMDQRMSALENQPPPAPIEPLPTPPPEMVEPGNVPQTNNPQMRLAERRDATTASIGYGGAVRDMSASAEEASSYPLANLRIGSIIRGKLLSGIRLGGFQKSATVLIGLPTGERFIGVAIADEQAHRVHALVHTYIDRRGRTYRCAGEVCDSENGTGFVTYYRDNRGQRFVGGILANAVRQGGEYSRVVTVVPYVMPDGRVVFMQSTGREDYRRNMIAGILQGTGDRMANEIDNTPLIVEVGAERGLDVSIIIKPPGSEQTITGSSYNAQGGTSAASRGAAPDMGSPAPLAGGGNSGGRVVESPSGE